MKNNIITKAVAGIVVAATLCGCADDYLDTKPVTSISTNVVTSNITATRSTYYGIVGCMYGAFSLFPANYFLSNGESWLNTYHAEHYGQDCFEWLWGEGGMGPYILNWDGMTYGNYWMGQMMWSYAYTIINYSNGLLFGVDDMEGSEAEKLEAKYYKAGALCFRAHAYIRLLQVYGPRLEDSNNGQELAAIIRTTQSTDDKPLSTFNEVLDLIYSDLDEAIALFEESGHKRGNSIWEPNIDVARGLYSRAALIRHDWKKAKDMAHAARANYPLMTGDQYKSGFAVANQEWMWANINDPFLYYYAYGATYACNGPYPCVWGSIGAGAINYDLYRQIPEGDIRRDLYFTPDKVGFLAFESDFFNPKLVMESNLNVNHDPNLKSELKRFCKVNKPNADWPDAYAPTEQTDQTTEIYVPFGAQIKFWGQDVYGTCQVPFMRGAEMLFNEAEAAYELGDVATAKQLLEELNALRQPGYTCTTSGEALRDEIRLYRRMELWGEGFNWYDLKRWNTTMERKPWIAKDTNSNNIPKQYAITKQPSDNNGWRFAIPMSETEFNKLISVTGENTEPAEETKSYSPYKRK